MYNVVFSKKASKDYDKLEKVIKKPIDEKIEKLKTNPYPEKERGKKKLKNPILPDFRIVVKGFRILYDIYEGKKEVLIIRIRKKDKKIYKT